MIWLRIDANNLDGWREFVGIDNIRFGQVENGHPVDPADINVALQQGAVPEGAAILVWLGGLACVTLFGQRRAQRIAG